MHTIIAKTIKVTVAISLLASLAACAQTGPSMVDYSYVPSGKLITIQTSPGIESF
jgi:hypothetical protein